MGINGGYQKEAPSRYLTAGPGKVLSMTVLSTNRLFLLTCPILSVTALAKERMDPFFIVNLKPSEQELHP